jgi:hypothetical protein
MPYCTNCGKPVQNKHKYCAFCGSPLESAEAIQPAESVQFAKPVVQPSNYDATPGVQPGVTPNQGESICYIIPNLIVPKSFGRSDTYNLIVTEKRSIFAKLTSEIMNTTVKARRAKAESEGKGFFGKWAAQMKGFNTYVDHYQNFSPEQALKETVGNYDIENSSIQKIRVQNDTEDQGGMNLYYIEIQTAGKKLSFRTSMYDPSADFKRAYPAVPAR